MPDQAAPPWKRALGLAPALVDNGRKLWARVASRPRPSSAPPAAAEAAAAGDVRIIALERRVADLEAEAAASFDVVRSMAEQHSQLTEQNAELVRTVDSMLSRMRALAWGSATIALAVLVLAVVAIVR